MLPSLAHSSLGPVSLQIARALAPYATSVVLRALGRRAASAAAQPLPEFDVLLTHYGHRRQLLPEAGLSGKEQAMVRLYMAGCAHRWEDLPGKRPPPCRRAGLPACRGVCRLPAAAQAFLLPNTSSARPPAAHPPATQGPALSPHLALQAVLAREYVAAGCCAEELRGCVRHLAVFAGYPLCLAATLTLQREQVGGRACCAAPCWCCRGGIARLRLVAWRLPPLDCWHQLKGPCSPPACLSGHQAQWDSLQQLGDAP